MEAEGPGWFWDRGSSMKAVEALRQPGRSCPDTAAAAAVCTRGCEPGTAGAVFRTAIVK